MKVDYFLQKVLNLGNEQTCSNKKIDPTPTPHTPQLPVYQYFEIVRIKTENKKVKFRSKILEEVIGFINCC